MFNENQSLINDLSLNNLNPYVKGGWGGGGSKTNNSEMFMRT